MSTEIVRPDAPSKMGNIVWTLDVSAMRAIARAFNTSVTNITRGMPGCGSRDRDRSAYGFEQFEGLLRQVRYDVDTTDDAGTQVVRVQKTFNPYGGGGYRETWHVSLDSLAQMEVHLVGRRVS